MKKLFLFMSWVMLILSGCADEDIIERNSPSFPQSVNTRSAGDGVYDILGYGYDITGPYLDTKSSRAIVFDTNKLLEKGLITPYKLEESRFRYSSGKDVIDFTTNMSSSLQMSTPGILKVIGGASLNIAFGGNSHYNSDYSFAYCTQQYIDSRYRISEADINVLKTCLTKQFIERLSTYTPEQIVEEYGTHVLKDIYLGAKFEVYYMAKSTSSSKKESINAGLGASLFSLFKMDGKFQYDESLAITNKEQSLYYFTIGGDPAVGVQGSLNPENSPSIDIGKWMASVKSSTPKFIDVDNNSQSFIPIYELVTDPTKKQTLKAYIDNYIKSKEVCSISLYPSTTGTRQVSGLGHINQGAGVAIGDIDKNGRPDMILMGIDNPKGKNNFWYKVLYDIDENGYYSKESSILSISAEGWENSGGDIALCDLNNNGILDMVLLCTDKPTTAGRAYRWYYVAYDLKPDGHYNSLSSLNTKIEISKLIVNKGIVNYSRELKFSNLKCVSRITGAEINGTNGLPIVEFEVNNRTNELYNVGGTDLGIVWELQPGHYGLFFGDTFGSDFYPNFVNPGPNGSNWRSNVLLFSDDQDLSDGLTINGATMDESGKNAREICYGGKDGSGNGDWTSIPTAAIRANGIDYVHYMNIRNWAGWITNFSSLYKSSDNGITWTRCQNVKFGSTSNFGQVSYFKKDGYIYMVGTITGRDNKPHLARFLEENIENQTEYEFWNGSGWIKGNETAATPLFNDISGELSIAYHPEFKKWILLYFNSTRYDISFRTADHIIGEWSKPQKLVDGWQYSQLYGSYIHPISLKGNILYFIMSMWLPYNTYLMSAELKCNP